MYNYVTEPDFFRHEKPERLICERIEIEGYGNQRTVLNVPVRQLRPFKLYELVIRQPIPSDARGLPLYIKGIADQDFFPNISVGHGRKDEVHWVKEEVEMFEGREEGEDCCVEVITEKVEAKMFRVTTWGYNNQAFANQLVKKNFEPYPFIYLYLNDNNEFVLLENFCRPHKHAKKLIRRKEIIVREPIHTESIGIGRSVTEFVHPRRNESFETWVEGSFSHGGAWGHGHGRGNRGW